MKIIKIQNTRTNQLWKKVIRRLPEKVRLLVNDAVVQISNRWENQFWNHGTSGYTKPINTDQTKFAVYLNIYALRRLSNKSVIGVMAHELGHVWDEYGRQGTRKLFAQTRWRLWKWAQRKGKLIQRFVNNPFFDREWRVDNLARSWGFGKEIRTLHREHVFTTHHVPVPKEQISDIVDAHTILKLRCTHCRRKWQGEYTYADFLKSATITLTDQGVPVAQLLPDKAISDRDIITFTDCFKCRKGKLIILKRQVVRY